MAHTITLKVGTITGDSKGVRSGSEQETVGVQDPRE